MEATTQTRQLEELSDLIGAIYECVAEPARWDEVLDNIRRVLECANCVLSVADMHRQILRAEKTLGIRPYWRRRIDLYGPAITECYSSVPDFHTRPLDEPFVLRKDVPEAMIEQNRYYREWAIPNGIVDVIQIVLMRESRRNATLALGRHKSAGPITEREIRLMRLLAPHVRRAVTLSGLIDKESLRAARLGATLDMLSVGVVLAAPDGHILHANGAAKRMLRSGNLIRERAGRLMTRQSESNHRLRQAIAAVATRETEIEREAFKMAVAGRNGGLATVHVLPLGRGGVRPMPVPRAAAAIFVATGEASFGGGLEAVGEAFELTPAEMRLLQHLMLGESLDEAAAALGVARTTVKTHLSRILSKTGTRRQTSLLALVHRLSPAFAATRRPPASVVKRECP